MNISRECVDELPCFLKKKKELRCFYNPYCRMMYDSQILL